MKFSKVTMEPNNRMVRIGVGQNESRWFFRIDFWWFGIRITKQFIVRKDNLSLWRKGSVLALEAQGGGSIPPGETNFVEKDCIWPNTQAIRTVQIDSSKLLDMLEQTAADAINGEAVCSGSIFRL